MNWLFAGAAVAVLIVVNGWLIQRENAALGRRPDAEPRPQAPTPEDLAERVVRAAAQLTFVEKGSPLLHRPVYDCASDSFELPCQALGRSAAQDIHNLGRFRGRQAMEEAARGLAETCWHRGMVHLASDHVTMVWTDDWSCPGGMVWRLVRMGPEDWFGYYWRAGMRPSAGAADPPFTMKDLRRDPSAWVRREAALSDTAQGDGYAGAAARCPHGSAVRS